MKNLISLFVLFIITLGVNAQDVDKNGRFSGSYGFYPGVTSDSITANQDTIYITFTVSPTESVLWELNVNLDEVEAFGANDSVKIEPFGKVFDNDTYTSIGTADYWDAEDDNPIKIEEKSTADFISKIQVRLTNIGTGKSTLKSGNTTSSKRDIELKIWDN